MTQSAVDLARDLARQFASRAEQADRQGRLPDEDVRALQDSGYLSLSVPKSAGGWGLGLRDCAEAQLELAQGSGSTAMVATMPLHLIGAAQETKLWLGGQFERICAILTSGGLINSLASEPRLGSPSRGGAFQSRAEPVDEGWRINGQKNWSTGGRHLTHLLVKLDIDGTAGQILIPNNIDGVRWEETWCNALSLRASDSDDVYFENVIVPTDSVLDRSEGGTAPGPNAWFPVLTASVYLGVALAARHDTIRFALDRVPSALGKPIATLPKIQRQIGEMDVQLQVARQYLLYAAQAWDEQGAAAWAQVVTAKHIANEAAISVTEQALRVAGGQSITGKMALERYFRDARGGLTHPPSGDTSLEIVGRAAIAELEA